MPYVRQIHSPSVFRDNDDVFVYDDITARRQSSTTSSTEDCARSSISSAPDIFHRALSRRKTLAELEELEFNLPALPVDEDIEDDDEPSQFCFTRSYDASRGKPKVQRRIFGVDRTVSLTEIRSARKVPLAKTKSPTGNKSEIIRERLKKVSENGHSKFCEIITVEDQIVALDSDGISKPWMRKSSATSDQLGKLAMEFFNSNNREVTVYPGNDKQSDTSLPDWQVKQEEAAPPIPSPTSSPSPPSPPRQPTPPPPPREPTPPPEYTDTESSYIIGIQASVGRIDSMTLSNKSDEVEGIETSFGPSTPMSLLKNKDAPHPSSATSQTNILSDGNKKRRRSVKEVFRMGFFLSKKNKKRHSLSLAPGSTQLEPVAVTPPPNLRTYNRRMSRLDMNEPIEDVFAGIKFATIEKNSSDDDTRDASDDDIHSHEDDIEDPDVILASLLQQQCSANEEKTAQDNDLLTFEELPEESQNYFEKRSQNNTWDDLT
ncbi:unnamed protein product [Clavelina lepadiformis]|uniref:Uncharacterized protein n=1 Tax=Clavelina lepadiformis TaxID=159417 RepID=A0ABP0GW33_CLALP